MSEAKRIAYADPPYPGCAHLYKNHPDFGGEVDHATLIARLVADFDGFILHTTSVSLRDLLPLCPPDARVMSWVKPFAAFKRNVSVAYAWEPVIVRAARKPTVSHRLTLRDWVSCPITMKKGLAGAKPEAVAWWAFEVVGASPIDTLDDLYPGTGAIGRAWEAWRIRASAQPGEAAPLFPTHTAQQLARLTPPETREQFVELAASLAKEEPPR